VGEKPLSEGLSTGPLTIRASTWDDAPGIIELLEPFVLQRKLLRRTEQEIAELTRHGYMAEADGLVVGFAAVEVYSRKMAELQCLAVRDGYHHRGIGRELVRLVIDRARKLGVLEVLAISSSDAFLLHCGFDYSMPDQKRALFYQLRERHSEEEGEITHLD
jgi:amino-acid N-acetyltransferase